MAKAWDPYWIEAIKTEFIPQITYIVDVLKERLLPNIKPEDIEAESERITDDKWEQLMSTPGTGDEDPGDFADKAQIAGISHYGLMYGIRQGLINLFAVALYHAFEQQAMYFHRKNVLNIDEENNPKKIKIPVFQKRLKKFGVNIGDFASWPKIYDELRHVANVAKHAEGDSSSKLKAIRRDMFENPFLSDIPLLSGPITMPMYQPLIGDGLYVSLIDIEKYRDHLVRFWQEFADSLHEINQK